MGGLAGGPGRSVELGGGVNTDASPESLLLNGRPVVFNQLSGGVKSG